MVPIEDDEALAWKSKVDLTIGYLWGLAESVEMAVELRRGGDSICFPREGLLAMVERVREHAESLRSVSTSLRRAGAEGEVDR